MHPTLLPRPFHHDGWVYEEKVDGYRMVAAKAGGVVQLIKAFGGKEGFEKTVHEMQDALYQETA